MATSASLSRRQPCKVRLRGTPPHSPCILPPMDLLPKSHAGRVLGFPILVAVSFGIPPLVCSILWYSLPVSTCLQTVMFLDVRLAGYHNLALAKNSQRVVSACEKIHDTVYQETSTKLLSIANIFSRCICSGASPHFATCARACTWAFLYVLCRGRTVCSRAWRRPQHSSRLHRRSTETSSRNWCSLD